MTYPPVKHAGPLHPRNLTFSIIVAVISGLLYVPLQKYVVQGQAGTDVGNWGLQAIGPIIMFVNALPPAFSEYRWWLRRLLWWIIALCAGHVAFAGIVAIQLPVPILVQLLAGTIAANITWVLLLHATVERRDDLRRGTLIMTGVIFSIITAGTHWLFNTMIR